MRADLMDRPDSRRRRIVLGALGVATIGALPVSVALAESPPAIARIKPSVVAVGTFQKTRTPAFAFRGTGFVVGDGTFVATNAHVLPGVLDTERQEVTAVALPGPNGGAAQVRAGRTVAIDAEHDLALIKLEGIKLSPLDLGDSTRVSDGENLLFTGYPIGTVLGLFPATHRAMVSAISPIAIPGVSAQQLDAKAIKRLSAKRYPIMQLDATAYPGNSGSPLYDPSTGKVVGILNMVLVKESRETVLSQPSGITYAIPVQPLIDLLGTVK